MTKEYTTEQIKFIIKTVHLINKQNCNLRDTLTQSYNTQYPSEARTFDALYHVFKKHKNTKVHFFKIYKYFLFFRARNRYLKC